jgi:formylglycine-generating enzyme required for sulfatase activity
MCGSGPAARSAPIPTIADGREDPSDPAEKRFTLRGGAWGNLPVNLRAAARYDLSPDFLNQDVGFRLARRPPHVKRS